MFSLSTASFYSQAKKRENKIGGSGGRSAGRVVEIKNKFHSKHT